VLESGRRCFSSCCLLLLQIIFSVCTNRKMAKSATGKHCPEDGSGENKTKTPKKMPPAEILSNWMGCDGKHPLEMIEQLKKDVRGSMEVLTKVFNPPPISKSSEDKSYILYAHSVYSQFSEFIPSKYNHDKDSAVMKAKEKGIQELVDALVPLSKLVILMVAFGNISGKDMFAPLGRAFSQKENLTEYFTELLGKNFFCFFWSDELY